MTHPAFACNCPHTPRCLRHLAREVEWRLSATCWSLGYNFDQRWIPDLLKAYGMAEVDQEKMEFYAQLENLVWASEFLVDEIG